MTKLSALFTIKIIIGLLLGLATNVLGFSALQPTHHRWMHLRSLPDTIEELSRDFPGLAELAETIKILNRPLNKGGCPWTNEQTVRSLVKHLQDELEEVKEALDALDDMSHFNVNDTGHVSDHEVKSDLLAEECGDVLFNALMLCAALPARSQGPYSKSTMDEVALNAAAKIRRRTPYMTAWGADRDSSSVDITVNEAQNAWQAAKRNEDTLD
jgi:NTP pyrophosphatase (non-canonical NTP hydrolase)